MRKIRLSDTDLELFDIEIGPQDYLFYQRHKDAFKTMWREQGKPFWTRFQITFRSFTVKHGIIKQMNIDTPKFQNLLDQAFIFIHENFVDGKESIAKNFIDDVARLAQNQDKFPGLDSKSFAKDPFFARDTRELFRKFFGPPDQKSSYLKVYILSPVYLRFGGSVCRCLIRWMDAPQMDDPNDDSYWLPPQPNVVDKSRDESVEITMCSNCVDDCGTKYFREKIMGNKNRPISMDFWTLGDPRFNDGENPLFAPHLNPTDDWRDSLTVELFRDFYNFTRFKYGTAEDKCKECQRMKRKRDKFIHVCKQSKKKKKQETKDKEELIKDLKEVRTRIDELEEGGELQSDYEARVKEIIKDKPRVREALEEAERKEKLEKLHNEQLKAEAEKEKAYKDKKRLQSPEKKKLCISDLLDRATKVIVIEAELKDDDVPKKTDTSKSKKDVSSNIGNENIEVKDSENETASRESSVEKESNSSEGSEIDIEKEESGKECLDKNTDEKEFVEDEAKNSLNEPNEKGDSAENDKDTTESEVKEEKDSEEKSEDGLGAANNDVFNEETAKRDQSHYSLLSDKDLTPNKNIVSGFKVIKIEDANNGLFEVNVSAACLKSDAEEASYIKAMKEKLKTQELNNFILSANLLREKIYGLPQRLEWWEGRGFAVAVVNFEDEEKELTKKWTNFTLKINGYDENAIKQILIKLLIYVSKRKSRQCPGWSMEVDDVVACILPEESPGIEDLSISISRGFRFEDRLTEFEKESLLKHYPTLNLDLVLTGIDKGDAVKGLEKKGGKEKLRKIIDTVADKEIFAKDLPVVDVEKLRKKLNNKEEITKADILWEQLIRKPENFEFFVLLEKEKVLLENDWWKLGMRNMDIRYYNTTKDPERKICPICKIVGMDCSCEKPVTVEPRIVEFVESSDFEKVKVLGDEDGPQLPKMKYTETNLSMPGKPEKSEKKSKSSKSAKKKEKRIELSDLPAKFLEAGIDAEKTTITIPSKEEEPMMGRVPIPVSDKLERLAPVPGVQSSLNFTFQNGKKEQTITVTLGAYMPEDKINEIQEKKGLLKILEEEEKRLTNKATGHIEKKDKKDKKKKEKPKTKSPQKNTTQEKDEDNDTRKEKTADITTRFLKEIFADEKKLSTVTRTLHQHMGLSNKRQAEKKAVRDEKKKTQDSAASSGCSCPHHDEILEMKREEAEIRAAQERREKLTDIAEQLMDVIDNKKTSRRYRENDMPKAKEVVKEFVSDKPCTCQPKETDLQAEKAKTKKSKNGYAEVERAEEDKLSDETNDTKDSLQRDKDGSIQKNGIDVNGEGKDGSSFTKESGQSENLRTCGNCEKVEPTRKAFKKCQKCKDEGVLEVRYYCSRECQVDDWKNKHKMEHRDGLLG